MLLTGFLSSGASCGDGQEPRCSKGSRRGQGMQRCPPASWEETLDYSQAVTGAWSVVVTANYLNENRALVSSFFEQLSVLGTRMQKEHHGSSNSLCWNIPTAVSSSGGLCQCYGWSSNWPCEKMLSSVTNVPLYSNYPFVPQQKVSYSTSTS